MIDYFEQEKIKELYVKELRNKEQEFIKNHHITKLLIPHINFIKEIEKQEELYLKQVNDLMYKDIKEALKAEDKE